MKVISKQKNSKMCIICGLDNPIGLKAPFYNMQDGSVMTQFKYREVDQSYPQRVHGGMISSMLDELAGRALWVQDETQFGVTMTMETKFRKPIPYDVALLGKGEITKTIGRFFIAKAYIMNQDGKIYAEYTGKFLKLPVDEISKDINYHEELCYDVKDDITNINY